MEKNTRDLALSALFIALVAVSTMAIAVPTFVTKGYVNVGDAMIYFVALTFGKRMGALCGGIGSAIADILLSYAQYAPITLVVKGLEGFMVGYLFEKSNKTKLNALLACGVGAVIMVSGYLFFEMTVLFYGKAALLSVPGNAMQGIVSLILAQVLYYVLSPVINKNK